MQPPPTPREDWELFWDGERRDARTRYLIGAAVAVSVTAAIVRWWLRQ